MLGARISRSSDGFPVRVDTKLFGPSVLDDKPSVVVGRPPLLACRPPMNFEQCACEIRDMFQLAYLMLASIHSYCMHRGSCLPSAIPERFARGLLGKACQKTDRLRLCHDGNATLGSGLLLYCLMLLSLLGVRCESLSQLLQTILLPPKHYGLVSGDLVRRQPVFASLPPVTRQKRQQKPHLAVASASQAPSAGIPAPGVTVNVQENLGIPIDPIPLQTSKAPMYQTEALFEFEVDPTALKVNNLEKLFKQAQGVNSIPDIEDGYTNSVVTLPDRFKMSYIDRFDGSMRLFSNILRPMGLTRLQKLSLFGRTLLGIAAIWYAKLEDSIKVTTRDLEATRQEPKEGFSDFVTQWRAKASMITIRPSEKDQHGHDTDQCYRLRHEIQDLINNKEIALPQKPNVSTVHLALEPLNLSVLCLVVDQELVVLFLREGGGLLASPPTHRPGPLPIGHSFFPSAISGGRSAPLMAGPYVFCMHSLTLTYAIWILGHRALRCSVGGPRVTPLSLRNDREGGCAHIPCKYTAMPLFVLCCNKMRNYRKQWPISHQSCRPTTKAADRLSELADGHPSWPTIPQHVPKVGQNFQKYRKWANRGILRQGSGFSGGRDRSCILHCSRIVTGVRTVVAKTTIYAFARRAKFGAVYTHLPKLALFILESTDLCMINTSTFQSEPMVVIVVDEGRLALVENVNPLPKGSEDLSEGFDLNGLTENSGWLSDEPDRDKGTELKPEEQKARTAAMARMANGKGKLLEKTGCTAPTLTFSDKELPSEGSAHNKPLYISLECREKWVLVVLVDTESAINVCPSRTTYAIGLRPVNFVPTAQVIQNAESDFDSNELKVGAALACLLLDPPINSESLGDNLTVSTIGDQSGVNPFSSILDTSDATKPESDSTESVESELDSVSSGSGFVVTEKLDKLDLVNENATADSEYFCVPLVYCIDHDFQNFDDNEEEGIPLVLKILINREERRFAKPLADEIIAFNVGTEKDPRLVQIRSTLCLKKRERLVTLLKDFKDIFTWSYEDMPGIDPEIVQHRIPLDPKARPVK
ncbi:hypothetical protein HYC85_028307 [Camellia sinensis]|uniref:Uncharacterized protein n=1 Tax=Camellia sinensis TaxID=4442 RepID=A0A7J7FYS4_CAMSI|nr:hypothetical protein HYC85_028307 [Camellia sinensis]